MDPEPSLVLLGSTLHVRLVDGDPTASAEIAEIFLPALLKRMEYSILHDPDPQLAEQAAIDALENYLGRPAQYEPAMLDLLAYLFMSAKGDLANARDSARRRARWQDEFVDDVANIDGGSEYQPEYADDTDFADVIIRNDSNVYQLIAELFADPIDRFMVELMLEGVHRTEPYAIVLQITHLPNPEQARMVKQHKDRIKARLRRNLDPNRIRAEARGNV